jgi:hypothetical protein
MIKGKVITHIRKTNSYLGFFSGIQFLMRPVNEHCFSVTFIDEMHRNHLRNTPTEKVGFKSLVSTSAIDPSKLLSENYGIIKSSAHEKTAPLYNS